MMQNKAVHPGRVSVYEWLRLIATLMVVLGHSTYLRISTQYGYLNHVSALEWLAPVYYGFFFDRVRVTALLIYQFHMPVFFFLSGAVLHLKPIGPLKPFVQKKARRLILPYYLCGLLFMLPVKIFTGFYTPENLPKGIWGFLVGGSDSGHLWFLAGLFWCMVVFALLQKTAERFLAKHSGMQVFVLLAIGAVVQLCAERMPFELLGIVRGLQYFFWFCLGYAFEPLRHKHAVGSTTHAAALLATVTLFWVAGSRLGMLGSCTTAFVGCVWTYLLALVCSRVFAPLEQTRLYRLLTASLFAVYLYHDPLEHLVLWLTMKTQLASTNAGCWLYLLARTVGVMVAAILMDRGLQWLAGRIKEKKN